MTIEVGLWAVPILLLIAGWAIANWFMRKNYSPGGYIPDMFTPMIALAIFAVFAVAAIAGSIGYFIFWLST